MERDWVEDLLRQPELAGWRFGKRFDSAPQSLVVACEERGGARRAGILKASAADPGRVMNEANYMAEMRARATRLLGSPEGFPEILLRPVQVAAGGLRPACFVEERIEGGSLAELHRAGKCWSVPEVAMLAQQMICRLQVLHTHEHSLGLVHNDIKLRAVSMSHLCFASDRPANVLYDAARAVFYLIDLDCATAIPSVAPKKKGALKKVQGSYAFSGADVLGGDYPSPKADLDALGQLLLWCLAGQPLWSGARLEELRAEKLRWREAGPVRARRWGALLPQMFCQYFERLEALESVVERPDYPRLAALFAPIAAPRFGPAALPAPPPLPAEEKENSSSPVLVRKKKAAAPPKRRAPAARDTSPARPAEPSAAAPPVSSGPSLRPRRKVAAPKKK